MRYGILLRISSLPLIINTIFIPRSQNEQADSLAIAASNFKVPAIPKLRYEVEIRYRPSIPDNIKYWKVFEEDSELVRFLETVQEFSDIHIDGELDNLIAEQGQKLQNRIGGHDVMQLPTNFIPKGLVPLERIFDQNDVPTKPPDPQEIEEVSDCNLGTKEHPKFVKISKALSDRQRGMYEKLLQEFSDVFAWKYDVPFLLLGFWAEINSK